MASNDYYKSFGPQDTSYHGGAARQDAPLPNLPPHDPYGYSSGHANHPDAQSPFDDHSYPAYPAPNNMKPYQSSYDSPYDHPSPSPYAQSGYASSYNHSTDPFADQNAIPLQSQNNSKQHFGEPPSPTIGMGQAEQQYGQKPPGRGSSKGRGGWFKGKITWAVYTLSLIQLGVFIGEIVRQAVLTGSPIAIHPSFNPMIGPSAQVLINMGARYVPCMREYSLPNETITIADPSVKVMCPNATSVVSECSLAEACGFGLNLTPHADGSQPQPDQWWRFIVPIFLHGGIIHIGFNLLLQLTLGRDMEKQIGPLRFLLIYFSAGIFGFVFGGNFAPNGLASTGCSGALFGILAVTLLDLLYSWKTRENPVRDLLFILLDVVISFIIGLLPALDNFSHIGGFITGLVLGVCILHSPDALRERIGLDEPPYSSVAHAGAAGDSGVQAFVKKPVGFFKGRKPLWWAWWLLRAGALVAVLVGFIVLLRNFYVYRTNCTWCKYLSCLPVKNWCDVGNLQFTNQTSKLKLRGLEDGLLRILA